LITSRLKIPTIGIGAGVECDGQVQVFHDLFGLFSDFVPRHTRRFAELGELIKEAAGKYAADVEAASFPSEKESFTMDPEVLRELKSQTGLP
jgi:3-methyl-2-oxobutanoate hydroxymethyltransferase